MALICGHGFDQAAPLGRFELTPGPGSQRPIGQRPDPRAHQPVHGRGKADVRIAGNLVVARAEAGAAKQMFDRRIAVS